VTGTMTRRILKDAGYGKGGRRNCLISCKMARLGVSAGLLT
jgi:hypothetical protein